VIGVADTYGVCVEKVIIRYVAEAQGDFVIPVEYPLLDGEYLFFISGILA
jgi:hypothetical protein